MTDSTIPAQSILHALAEMHHSAQGRHFVSQENPHQWKNGKMKAGYLLAVEEMQAAVREMCHSPR